MPSETVRVAVEDARQDSVAALLVEADAIAARPVPGAPRRALDGDALAAPGIAVFVARTTMGEACGCCALFDSPDNTVELKRMIVGAAFRGHGVGRALLDAVERHAVALGKAAIRMEVGIRNVEAQALYRSVGFVERDPFGAYAPSPISRYFERRLAPV